MRITILNGNPEAADAAFEGYLGELSRTLESRNHRVGTLQLRDMDIRYCIGCFGCWVKTPGECSNAADDMRTVCREYINSGLVIFASPVIMGFTSALLKRAHDRLIPLLTPYIRFFGGESHHVARYDAYPLIGLLIQPEADTDQEDIDIIADIYRRDAINFKTAFPFMKLTTSPVEEAADAIDGL
jgi:multimeric flavodoxin WrbA